MLEVTYAFFGDDRLFVGSPVFFFLFTIPILCLFLLVILEELKKKSLNQTLTDDLGLKDLDTLSTSSK